MKNLLIMAVVPIFLVTVFLISPVALAFASGCIQVSEDELSGIAGMGARDIAIVPCDSGISFTYSEISGNAFQNASGIIIVTPVPGNGNTISYLIDFDVTIYMVTINGDTVVNLNIY